jgi:hypothetical protein
MLLILTVVDCRGEAKDLSHAASKLRSPAWWLLIHGSNIFYRRVVALGPQNLHFMGCDTEGNGVNEGALISRAGPEVSKARGETKFQGPQNSFTFQENFGDDRDNMNVIL